MVVDREEQISTIAAELDDDKQAWCDVFDDDGIQTGERILVKGSRPTNEEGAQRL